MRRADLVAVVQQAVRADVDAMERMVAMSRDEATSDESRPENKYDTRALEASYLAAGQGRRLLELQRLEAWLGHLGAPTEAVRLGSFVELDEARWVLLGPAAGPTVPHQGVEISVISTASPLGRALQGLEEGDEAELPARSYTLTRVC